MRTRYFLSAGLLLLLGGMQTYAEEIRADFTHFKPAFGTEISQVGTNLRISWPIYQYNYGVLILQLKAREPLIGQFGIAASAGGPYTTLLSQVNPVTWLTVGQRDLSSQGWNVFFDSPPKRPHETFPAILQIKGVRVESLGRRSTVILDGLTAGPFHGDLRFSVYAGCRLVHAEAVVSTDKDSCAILYDAGLTGTNADKPTAAWIDTSDQMQRAPLAKTADIVASRQRTIIAEVKNGSVALFPPPHQFIYPLDFADNFKLVWHGNAYRNSPGWGLGVRQPPDGDKRHVPWVNAPPGSQQRLGIFYLLTFDQAPKAIEQVRQFTHGDRFKKLEGYTTFTHHYHIEHALEFLAEQRRQKTDQVPKGLEVPPFVKTFKAHGVDIVHLAEFHVGHTPEMNANRLNLLKTMHAECRRLSDDRFLVLPGEEPNVHLGGHWISLFPRPVNWLLHPKAGTPFEQKIEGVGTVYAVHNSGDILRLMEKENGLMWTAHPRTKGSYGFPDRYRDKDFYLSPHFLGAGWKHMPADYSQPRLGTRALDLLSEMPNWGQRKYVLGEVDIFKVLPTHELYGHMNINYLKLDKLPRFDDGWQPILDVLRQGRFFVSTGEVLIPRFQVAGKESGQTLNLSKNAIATVTAQLEWTFPLAFAEIIWGDGKSIHRERVDLADYEAFGAKELHLPISMPGAKWTRLEVWDIAANGAFTQPVWIE